MFLSKLKHGMDHIVPLFLGAEAIRKSGGGGRL